MTLAANGIGGLVFAYIDPYNFFALLANQESGEFELWEVTGNSGIGRTWTKRLSGGTVTTGLTVLFGRVRSGAIFHTGAGKYTGTISHGQVGLYTGTDSGSVKIDDFELLDTARMKNIDGRWETNVGDISLVSDKLEFGNTIAPEKLAVRRGFRGSKYVVELDLPTADGQSSGVLLHYPPPLFEKEGRSDSITVRAVWLCAHYAASPSVNARGRDTYHSDAKAWPKPSLRIESDPAL